MSAAPDTGPALRPASRLDGLAPYTPPERSDGAGLLLDANEGRPDAEAVASVLDGLDAESLRLYPTAAALERRLAERLGVDPERIVVTGGGDDAIDRVCRATLEPGRSAVLHTPTFEMIGRGARLAGASVREVPWPGGPFPIGAMAVAIDADVSLVAMVSPNNPTGGAIPTDAILEAAHIAAGVGAVAMVDLAYVEFADEDPTPALLPRHNVVMVRTFSKAFGLAGLRVGYAVAPPAIARWLRTVGGPYPVSRLSLAIAGRALEREAARRAFIDNVRRERAALTSLLAFLGAEPLPSQANFVSARVPDAPSLARSMAGRGVRIRHFANDPALRSLVRIALPGDAASYERLSLALRGALAPERSLP